MGTHDGRVHCLPVVDTYTAVSRVDGCCLAERGMIGNRTAPLLLSPYHAYFLSMFSIRVLGKALRSRVQIVLIRYIDPAMNCKENQYIFLKPGTMIR